MTTILRKVDGEVCTNFTTIQGDSWDLRTQIEALEDWMTKNATTLPTGFSWIADVGFDVRVDALGGGPPLTRNLMKLCIESNVEIYLSEYGMAHDGPDG